MDKMEKYGWGEYPPIIGYENGEEPVAKVPPPKNFPKEGFKTEDMLEMGVTPV